MNRKSAWIALLVMPLLLLSHPPVAASATAAAMGDEFAVAQAFMKRYCGRCHNEERFAGYWALVDVDLHRISDGGQLEAWEKIYRQTLERGMPPPERKKQPTDLERKAFTKILLTALEKRDAAHPNPGRATVRRLNRAEYSNAVQEVLAIELDVIDGLPADDSGYGFDNIADVLSVSTTLMDRYFAVAGRLSRLALGVGPATPVLTSHQVPKDGSILNQGIPAYNERMSPALPLDSRGGDAFAYYAPHTGSYQISGYLNANTNNEVDRLDEARYAQTVWLEAGLHSIGMSFRRQLALEESVQTLRNTTDIVPLPSAPPSLLKLDFIVDGARVGTTQVPAFHDSPRYAQQNFPRDVLQIDVEGPLAPTLKEATTLNRARQTHNRSALIRCNPRTETNAELRCARRSLKPLLRKAYRRPVTAQELAPVVAVFEAARQNESFDAAIATAIQAILVSPSFLFVLETAPSNVSVGADYRISDLEFATRLALFLWSSLPDEELLSLAKRKRLRNPRVLSKQVQRMLASQKARALTNNFAGQWLFLRNLPYHRADVEAYPEFDVRLRAAMRAESEQFFAGIVRDNRSLLEFLKADYSFLNERLAQHYGISGVYGPQLRRVALPASAQRGGLLGQASLLTLTSYGNHTSVVRRGQWILDALLAAPPPPPPPDVPALVAEQAGKPLTAREQLAVHRADPACASCHVRMDPLGLALEQFDAIGAYRSHDAGNPIDVHAVMPDGTAFAGLPGLQDVLLARKDQFARAFTEQLMTYALARGLKAHDRSTVRAIAKAAAEDGYRAHNVVLGIINSYAFNYRRVPKS